MLSVEDDDGAGWLAVLSVVCVEVLACVIPAEKGTEVCAVAVISPASGSASFSGADMTVSCAAV